MARFSCNLFSSNFHIIPKGTDINYYLYEKLRNGICFTEECGGLTWTPGAHQSCSIAPCYQLDRGEKV